MTGLTHSESLHSQHNENTELICSWTMDGPLILRSYFSSDLNFEKQEIKLKFSTIKKIQLKIFTIWVS